jgi:uncharacterized protein (DUF1684 family)
MRGRPTRILSLSVAVCWMSACAPTLPRTGSDSTSTKTPPDASMTRSAPSAEAAARDAWHAERLSRLQAPDGWLTLVGLDFLEEGEFTVGRDASATFSYPGCADEVIGRFVVVGESVRFVPEPRVEVSIERGTAGEPLVADDQGPPSVVRSGTVSFTLVRRNGRLALRVRDSASPVLTEFSGLELYPHDPTRVVEATVEPARDRTIAITNVTGFLEEQPLAATLRFELDGVMRELLATSAGEGRLFVVFGDETNGRETYGGGRFLEVPAPIDGRTTIDFNRAYNPPCAFTAFATCPMPPAGNRLPVRIEAGERRSQ